MSSSNKLRSNLRLLRRQLSRKQQQTNAILITRHLTRSQIFSNAEKIAIYLDNDGEPETRLLIKEIFKRHKQCFLPVLRGNLKPALWFCKYSRKSSLIPNRFGIPEPICSHAKSTRPWGLDLVLLPLVGFDATGNRIGMGGGFYDRTLEFLRSRSIWKKPKLIGIAHECQRLDHITPNSWDVPLDGIVTEQGFFPVVAKPLNALIFREESLGSYTFNRTSGIHCSWLE